MLMLLIILYPIAPQGITLKGVNLHKIPAFGDIILFILIVIFIVHIIMHKKEFVYDLINFIKEPMGISLIALFIIMIVSISYSSYKMIAISESARFLSFGILYFIVKYSVDKRVVRGLINSYMVIFTIINLYGILQKITGYGLIEGYVMENGVLRINGTFDNPNTFAAFLIIGIFPVVMAIARSEYVYEKLFYSILLIMSLCNIYFTGSRNSFLGILIGGIVLSILYNWYFLVGVGAVAVIGFVIPQVKSRILQIAVGDEGRIHIWKTALKMIQEHPLKGIGNGNFTELYDVYVAKYKYLAYKNYSHYPTHNSFLKIESELGIIGGISFISIIVNAIILVKKTIVKIEDKKINLFYMGFFASMVAFMFMNLIENLFFVPTVVVYFWIFLAAADGLIFSERY